MAHVADDRAIQPRVDYPRFDHGEDLFIVYFTDGHVEFQTGMHGQRIKSDTVFTLGEVR